MIKGELIELTQAMLQQMDKTKKYHERIVEALITLATNNMLMSVVDLDLYVKQYKNVDVTQDNDTDQYYSLYPAKIVDTLGVYKGVRSINTMKGTGLQFAPIRGSELQLFEGLDISAVSDVIGYRPETDRITYMGEPRDEDDNIITSVRMNLIIPFSEYETTDDYHIPGGEQIDLFNAVVSILRGIPPKDLINDNSDVTRQPKEE